MDHMISQAIGTGYGEDQRSISRVSTNQPVNLRSLVSPNQPANKVAKDQQVKYPPIDQPTNRSLVRAFGSPFTSSWSLL
jgi:hypothetical protein